MNPIRWIDRLVFALLLVATLQIPVLSDQYRQYLAGYVAALTKQVEMWQQLANEFNFSSIEGFLLHLETNSDPVVLKDTENKRTVITELRNKRAGLAIMASDNYPQQIAYMFAPENFENLQHVAENFQPGIPLSVTSIIYSVVLAIVLDSICLTPFWWLRRKKKALVFRERQAT